MAQTLEQINALRSFRNEELLSELPAENPENKAVSTEPVKETLSSDKPIIIDEIKKEETPQQGDEKPVVIDSNKEQEIKKEEAKELVVAEPLELDDTAILEALKKRGINVNSFEELTPKEIIDPEKAAEQREAAKLSFALSKGLYSKKEYENYIRDSNDLQNLVYGEYYKEAKKENSELTDQEVQEAFLAEYGLDADGDSLRYKRGINTVALLADKMLKDKYGKIYTTDQEFDKHESAEKSTKELHNRILLKAPSYKKDVEDIVKEMSKVIIPFDENESFEVGFSKEAIDNIKNQFLEEGYSISQIKDGWSKDKLKQVAYTALINMDLVNIVKTTALEYLYKHQKGTKGIPSSDKGAPVVDATGHLSENQKLALSYFKGEVPQESNAN